MTTLSSRNRKKGDKMPNHFNEYEYSENTIGIKIWMVSVLTQHEVSTATHNTWDKRSMLYVCAYTI